MPQKYYIIPDPEQYRKAFAQLEYNLMALEQGLPFRHSRNTSKVAWPEDIVQLAGLTQGLEQGKDYFVLELGRHTIKDPLPVFARWTPEFYLSSSGFTKEFDITLDFTEKYFKGGKSITAEEYHALAEESLGYVGTEEAFEAKRQEIEQAYAALLENGLEFIVYRTFLRPVKYKIPQVEAGRIAVFGGAIWDHVEFFVPEPKI